MRTSPDLVTWSQPAEGLRTADLGAWALNGSVRAPSVVKRTTGGTVRYLLYYTAQHRDAGVPCVGVASAAGAEGPFGDPATQPLICQVDIGGSRSASVFVPPGTGTDGPLYLTWVGGDQHVYHQLLSTDGTSFPAGSVTETLLVPALAWEAGRLDAPSLAHHASSNTIVLFYSLNEPDVPDNPYARQHGGGVNWASCTGTYWLTDCDRGQYLGGWLRSSSTVKAPGAVEVFKDAGGAPWVTYHGFDPLQCTGGRCTGNRSLRIDKLCFVLGVPVSSAPSTAATELTRHGNCHRDVGLGPQPVESVEYVGPVGHPPTVKGRDGGASGLIGGEILWTFGDTLFTRRSSDGRWLRTNSAGWADPSNPNAIVGPLDAAGTPLQFIPHTAEELTWEQQNPGSRVGLWPSTVLPLPDGSGLVAYHKLYVHPDGFDWDHVGVGLATVAPGSHAATRLPGLLFEDAIDGEASFGNGFIDADGYVYLYGDGPWGSNHLARAPVAQVAERGAWEFSRGPGAGWSPTVGDAVAVTSEVGSVSWNAYLGKYLAVGNAFLSDRVVLRTADRPEGPWSAPTVVFVGGPLDEAAALEYPLPVSYAGREHVDQAGLGGRRLVVTYAELDGLHRVIVTLG